MKVLWGWCVCWGRVDVLMSVRRLAATLLLFCVDHQQDHRRRRRRPAKDTLTRSHTHTHLTDKPQTDTHNHTTSTVNASQGSTPASNRLLFTTASQNNNLHTPPSSLPFLLFFHERRNDAFYQHPNKHSLTPTYTHTYITGNQQEDTDG